MKKSKSLWRLFRKGGAAHLTLLVVACFFAQQSMSASGNRNEINAAKLRVCNEQALRMNKSKDTAAFRLVVGKNKSTNKPEAKCMPHEDKDVEILAAGFKGSSDPIQMSWEPDPSCVVMVNGLVVNYPLTMKQCSDKKKEMEH